VDEFLERPQTLTELSAEGVAVEVAAEAARVAAE
jgi:hypothetical protein